MKPVECEFESEALTAVLQSRWPERVDASLRAHVAVCAICSDVVAIAVTIDHARNEMRARAVVPDPGRVWWLAQLRARREAIKAVGRPITVAQVIAFACAVGLLGACFGATSAWFQSALARITTTVAEFRIQALLPSATALLAEHSALALAMAALLFLVPAAVYLAISRD
ncbi:MAG TPA: hypothetical protein VLE22_05115 [Bryobacteraceae bacterium]|nr:hypothetical protein [Bryobacteraceae bacterium]